MRIEDFMEEQSLFKEQARLDEEKRLEELNKQTEIRSNSIKKLNQSRIKLETSTYCLAKTNKDIEVKSQCDKQEYYQVESEQDETVELLRSVSCQADDVQPEIVPEQYDGVEDNVIQLEETQKEQQQNLDEFPLTQQITDSQIEELKQGLEHGEVLIETNFAEPNQTLIKTKIIQTAFPDSYYQLLKQLNTAFLSDNALKSQKLSKKLRFLTRQSILQIHSTVQVEAQNPFLIDNVEFLRQTQKFDNDKAKLQDVKAVREQIVNLFNETFPGDFLCYFENNSVKFNQLNQQYKRGIWVLTTEQDTLLLDHGYCASIFSNSLQEQHFISGDLLQQQLIRLIQISSGEEKKQYSTFLHCMRPGNIKMTGISERSPHFLVIFGNFGIIYQIKNRTGKPIEQQNSYVNKIQNQQEIIVEPIAIFRTESTKICFFECMQLSSDNQKLWLCGTDSSSTHLLVCCFDLSPIFGLSDGWLQSDKVDKLVILKEPIILDSPINQQHHKQIYKIIEISSESYLFVSQRQIRMVRIRENELRFHVVPNGFKIVENELAQGLFDQLLKSKLVSDQVKSSDLFKEELKGTCKEYLQQSLITQATMDYQNRNISLVINQCASLQLSVEKLISGEIGDINGSLILKFAPISFMELTNQGVVISIGWSNNVLCQLASGPMSVTFNYQILNIQLIDRFNKQQKPSTVFQSSNICDQSNQSVNNQQSSLSSQDQQEFSIAIYQQSGSLQKIVCKTYSFDEQPIYNALFESSSRQPHDFCFPNSRQDEITFITSCDLNFLNITQQTCICQLTFPLSDKVKSYENAPRINKICHAPKSNVVAYFNSYNCSLIIVEPEERAMCFEEKNVFKNQTQNLYQNLRNEDPVFCMQFSKSGFYFLFSSNTEGIKIYSCHDHIQLIKFFELKQIVQLEVTQVFSNTVKEQIDVVCVLNEKGQIQLNTIPSILQNQSFRTLTIQKEELQFVIDRRTKTRYVPQQKLNSPFYCQQIQYIIQLLTKNINCGKQDHELIMVDQLSDKAIISDLRFLERRAITINTSQCVMHLLSAVIVDIFEIQTLTDQPSARNKQFIVCYSVETFSLTSGQCLQSKHLCVVVQNQLTEICPAHLVQSSLYGTFLFAISTKLDSYLFSVNLLFEECDSNKTAPRLQTLPFPVYQMRVQPTGGLVGISGPGKTIFLFQWNASDFHDSAEAEQKQLDFLVEKVIQLRIDKLALNSGIGGSGSGRFSVLLGLGESI